MNEDEPEGTVHCPQVPNQPSEPPPPAPSPGKESNPSGEGRTNHSPANGRASRSRVTNDRAALTPLCNTMRVGTHRSRSPLSRAAKDKGTMARVANPY